MACSLSGCSSVGGLQSGRGRPRIHRAYGTDRSTPARGILVPLDLRFNREFATLDGHLRIAVARRLDLGVVPVALSELPLSPRPWWAQDMHAEDYEQLRHALTGAG